MRTTPPAGLPVVLVLISIAPHGGAAPAREVVPIAARGFALTEVRLLDGPFREAMLRDQEFLLSLDLDRLLHTFRLNAGLPSSATPLGGWEAPDVELRGHSLGHFLSASALMYAATGDARFKGRADAAVAELARIQEALAKRANAGYLSAFPEEFFDRLEKRQRVWAPYYTIHKLMAGLLDVHELCANPQALDVVVKMAGWVKLRMDRLSDEQRQAALETEFGGMNEVLANLYAVTADPEHLRLARYFDHRAVFDPLARGEDRLDGLHANTQIPKAIGAAREYELSGETRYRDIASFFWQRVAQHRSYVTGGHSDNESFFPVERFSQHLGAASAETCNTYNMLKLTRYLFQWAPSAELMDFYERALLNHILASQDPATGMMIYYCPLKPGAFKTYSRPDASFWCCVGTGMENHAKYADTIYFHGDDSLYVNLFVPSELTWSEKGLVVRQETRFPEEDTTRLTLRPDRPLRLAVKVRYPAWARSGIAVSVNGRSEPISAAPGSYVVIERQWRKGDVIQVRLPMSLRQEAMPDDPKTVALLYGPLVLAGDLGREGLSESVRYGPSAPPMRRVAPVEVPALVVADPRELLASVRPSPGAPVGFRTEGIGRPRDVALVPFYKASDQRYTVYWNVYTPAEWDAHHAALAAADRRRQAIAGATVDLVNIDDPQSERDHGYRGEGTSEWSFEGRKVREARNGWFSYDLKVRPDEPMTLVFTYKGAEGRRRFDVLVDGEKLATRTVEYHPTELLDAEYPIPESMTRGKQHVTVRFQSQADEASAGIAEVRVVPALEKGN
ncbi:MAG TPA: beta-L-arabinofuranosidase domain-containing protein [Vicinamibacteria bacterium]